MGRHACSLQSLQSIVIERAERLSKGQGRMKRHKTVVSPVTVKMKGPRQAIIA